MTHETETREDMINKKENQMGEKKEDFTASSKI